MAGMIGRKKFMNRLGSNSTDAKFVASVKKIWKKRTKFMYGVFYENDDGEKCRLKEETFLFKEDAKERVEELKQEHPGYFFYFKILREDT